MAKIPGEFVPLDVDAPYDRAIRDAGPMAELLFYRGLMWARKNKRTAGFIADFALGEVGSGLPSLKRHAESLVRERLWLKARGGWQIRSFEKWNPESDHAPQKNGGAIGNHNRWHTDGKWSPDCRFCTPPPDDPAIAPPITPPIGERIAPPIASDRSPSQKEREKERESDEGSSSSLLPFVPRGAGAQR